MDATAAEGDKVQSGTPVALDDVQIDAAAVDGGPAAPRGAWSRNLVLAFSSLLLRTGCESIFNKEMLSVYIFLLTESDMAVGGIAGARGIIQLLTSAGAGIAADRYTKAYVLRVTAVVTAVALSVYFTAIIKNSVGLVVVGAMVWGFNLAIMSTALEAVVGDETTGHSRTRIYGIKHAMTQFCRGIGPIVAFILFLSFGDEWRMSTLRTILLFGICACAPLPFLLAIFTPKPPASAADDAVADDDGQELLQVDGDAAVPDDDLSDEDDGGDGDVDADADDGDDDALVDNVSSEDEPHVSILGYRVTRRHLPFILAGTDIWAALGAGASVQYFPLFFKRTLEMKPLQVSGIIMCGPLAGTLMALIVMRIAQRVGRGRTVIATKLINATCIVLIVVLRQPWLVGVIYVLRTSIGQSGIPLQRSIVMDVVSSGSRAKWAAAESLTQFSWTGSAVLGGWIASSYGYRAAFLMTAAIYYVGTLPYVLCYSLIPDSASKAGDGAATAKLKTKKKGKRGAKYERL